MPTRRLTISAVLAIALAVTAVVAHPVMAASHRSHLSARPASATAVGLDALLRQTASEYRSAFRSHDPRAAQHVRGMAGALHAVAAAAAGPGAGRAAPAAAQLEQALAETRSTLEIWPVPSEIQRLDHVIAEALGRRAAFAGTAPIAVSVDAALVSDARAAAADDRSAAAVDLAEAYSIFAQRQAARIDAIAPEQAVRTEKDLWRGIAAGQRDAVNVLMSSADAVTADLHTDGAVLGQISVSRGTIVTDAAIIIFREGLEAVLILAAITASFTGARRRLRRPVFVGAFLGLFATAVTYVLAQAILAALGDGGLRLQAITGLVAIAVLLVVTNWFFHRMYWSEWIARFNRRRKALERIDRLGFISGQTVGFVILGLTSVYREGFETVLFLQNLQVSAGTSATLLGVGIGLGATLAVGLITFALERKLPYKRMLIATGVLIGLVLAVMVGTTVHNVQGLGWLPSTGTGFSVDPRLSQWTGLYATWEGIGAQISALAVVYGSYALARQLQRRRRRRAIATSAPVPSDNPEAAAGLASIASHRQ